MKENQIIWFGALALLLVVVYEYFYKQRTPTASQQINRASGATTAAIGGLAGIINAIHSVSSNGSSANASADPIASWVVTPAGQVIDSSLGQANAYDAQGNLIATSPVLPPVQTQIQAPTLTLPTTPLPDISGLLIDATPNEIADASTGTVLYPGSY